MDSQNRLSSIVALLWQGKPSEAKKAMAKERESLETEIRKLEASLIRAKNEIAMLDAMMPTSTGAETSNQVQPQAAEDNGPEEQKRQRLLTPAQKQKRKKDVLAVVRRLAANQREITTDDIAQALKRDGVEIGVPDNRVNTAIGNIVIRSGQYEPVAKGVYKLKQPALNYGDTRQ